MKKMRKMVSLALTAAMTAGLMTGMGAMTASADSERTKITALLKGTESSEQFLTFDYLLKNFCEEKGLDYEIELVNDQQDYFTKLQMYINSDTLPDIFGCPNGALSAACKDVDALVDVGAELERNGYADKLNGAIRDFLTDADDGNLYLFPQALYCEFFMYRKDIFEDAGITEAPTTWKEFEEDCQKIADMGEIPVIVGGSDAWQLMRYLSFSPWRVTGPEFIQGYQAGTDSFSENESAKYAVNLLADLGTKGYFEPGFASVDFTSASNLFFGGTGAIFYTVPDSLAWQKKCMIMVSLDSSRYRIQKEWTICLQTFLFMQDSQKHSTRLPMMIPCRSSLTTCARIILMYATIRYRFFHHLVMKQFQKGFHSYSTMFSQCSKMRKQHGLPGMINLILMC